MGSGKGGGVGSNGPVKGNIGISSIPAGSRKVVQSLKEIVNCPESEIYAMLKECNMDPNETVNRLLSQDVFHEVKSKRDKKKESKDTTDFRSRSSNASNRSSRTGSDSYSGRSGLSYFNSNESAGMHGKPAYKKENGVQGYAGSSSNTSGLAGNNTSRWTAPSISDSASFENKMPAVSTSDATPASAHSSGFQPSWGGVPGQVSMADIVKRGMQQSKVMTAPNPSYQSVGRQHAVAPSGWSHDDLDLSQDHVPKATEINNESDLVDEWPSIEQPAVASLPTVLEATAGTELYMDSSNASFDRTNQHVKPQLDVVQVSEDGDVETNNANHIQEDNSRGSSLFDDNLYENMNSYQSHKHPYEHNEAEDDASEMAANMQQLSMQNDDQGTQHEEDKRTVIIPDHLQVHTPDCSHLSFGSFGAGIGQKNSEPYASMKNNLEETTEAADTSLGHLDNRNSEYYGDDHLRNNTEENIVHHQVNANTGNYDPPSVSQPEVLKQEPSEASQGIQYAYPSSAPGYNYENIQQLNAALAHQQTSSQMQNLAPFSSVMQGYTNSFPSTLLNSGVPTARETELPYAPFPLPQSMPTKYNNTSSSISGPPSISMPEALRATSISMAQSTAQTQPGASVATGPALPQHLAVHAYTQPNLSLGHIAANMISYPLLHQGYTYMPPSAFQQPFPAGNSNYHQSLAAMLPQYKNSVSMSSLPHSAGVPSGYGFGSSTSIPGGNFPLNPQTAPAGTTIGYDDVLSSQFKDNSHLVSLQQNDNAAMWLQAQGHGSRTMSAVPASTYYSYQGQNQQQDGFQQQAQQPPQHYGGAHGYQNMYQTGMPLEHQQQQNSRDGSLGGSQGQQQSKQAQQLWQKGY